MIVTTGEIPLNGYVLSGTLFPEAVLETLLSYSSPDTLLTLRKVCRTWKEISHRRSFWKQVFANNGIDWDAIPRHVKDLSNSWMVFFSAAKYNLFGKNLIKNPCGYRRFRHWNKLNNGSFSTIMIESPPIGMVPCDPEIDDMPDSAFVTSYNWNVIAQRIDLWRNGLTPTILRAIIPFQFVFTLMVGVRTDCGGMYCTKISLQDIKNKGRSLMYNLNEGVMENGGQWAEVTSTLTIRNVERDLRKFRCVIVNIMGKDDRYLAGNCGPKFSRISVKIKCLTPAEARMIPEPRHYVDNPEAVLYIGRDGLSDFWNSRRFWRANRLDQDDDSSADESSSIDHSSSLWRCSIS